MGHVQAIILAAGLSERFGKGYKCFAPINGKPMLAYSIEPFQKSEYIDRILIATRTEMFPHVDRMVEEYGFSKVIDCIEGGETRQSSVLNSLMTIDYADYVLVHDGARPLVTRQLIEACLESAIENGAAVPAVRPNDTAKMGNCSTIEGTLPGNRIWLAQTPQAFRFEILMRAYRLAARTGFLSTDDSSLVEAAGYPVAIVCGSYRNIKVTIPDDLKVVLALLRRNADGIN